MIGKVVRELPAASRSTWLVGCVMNWDGGRDCSGQHLMGWDGDGFEQNFRASCLFHFVVSISGCLALHILGSMM